MCAHAPGRDRAHLVVQQVDGGDLEVDVLTCSVPSRPAPRELDYGQEQSDGHGHDEDNRKEESGAGHCDALSSAESRIRSLSIFRFYTIQGKKN